MQIKNLKPRLITINFKSESVKVLPAGPAVEVSDELATSKYAKLLEAEGDIIIIGEPKKVSTTKKTAE